MARFHSSILHGKFKPHLQTHGWDVKSHFNPLEDEWLFTDQHWYGHGRSSSHGRWHRHHPHHEPKPTEPNQDTHQINYAELLDEEMRNVDGTGNNQTNNEWGSAGTNLLRKAPASYDMDGSTPNEGPNPRYISNAILDQDGLIPNSYDVSDLFTYFGQFIDHDIDLTPEGHTETISFTHPDGPFPFAINRSVFDPTTGTDSSDPREHPNVITSYVDASNIYGSHESVTSILRADGGTSPYLITSDHGYAPTLGQLMGEYPGLDPNNVGGGPLAAGGANPDLFVAGDVRANENNALTSIHTVWIREHNHQVDKLKEYMPDATNEELFKAAKLIVEAEYQNIVFNEYLPLLLGADNIPEYIGYDQTVNAGVATEFSTAAYRLGHSQISPTLHRLDEDGSDADGGHLGLFQAFFNPTQLLTGGIDALVRGLGAFKGQEIDENIVDAVRNLLFGGTNSNPIDLGVFNILRYYDHGVPTLNAVREAYGLTKYTSFSDITSDMTLQAQFASVYNNNINQVELWVGGLAEDKYWGSQLGETFHHIVLDQFVRFRDGDRFYFEERMEEHPELLAMIKGTSFSEILVRTTGIDYFQDDAFIAHNRIGGDDGRDTLWGTDEHDLMLGFGGKDKLHGDDGNDDLYGGKGHDKLYGGDGRDVLVGEKGNDTAFGGDGNDILKGGKGHDTLFGEDGDDTIHGGEGRDTLIGGQGADTFVLGEFDARDNIADFEMQDSIDLTGLLDILDNDGIAGLTQGDVDNAVSLNWGNLSVRNPADGEFDTVAHIDSAIGGFPDSVSVLVDDDAGNEASFVV